MTDKKGQRYPTLASLKSGSRFDVYGVVKFVKEPFKTKGTDYCMTLSITDNSYKEADNKLKCVLFAKEENKLPLVEVGEIIRFHRLKISKFNEELQGSVSPGLSWLIFYGRQDDPLEPRKASSVNYTLTDGDKKIVKDLRDWFNCSREEIEEKWSKFEDIGVNDFYNTVCQVVLTGVAEPNVCMVLRAWDGTQCIHEVRRVDDSTLSNIKESKTLLQLSQCNQYDIFVFDDHFKDAEKVNPGDFIKLHNLHAVILKTSDGRSNDSIPLPEIHPIELNLHKGNSFGRCLRVVPPDSQDFKRFRRKLRKKCGVDVVDIVDSVSNNKSGEGANNTDHPKHVQDSQEPSTSGIQNAISNQEQVEKRQTRGSTTKANSQNASNNRIPTNNSNASKQCTVQLVNTPQAMPKDAIKTKTNTSHDKTVTGERNKSVASPKRNVGQSDSQEGPCKSLAKKKRVDRDVYYTVESVGEAQNEVADFGDTQSGTVEKLSGGVPRCMLQTAAVTLNHPHIKPTKVKEVLDHEVPYKFRVRAKIVDYHPKPTDVESFLQLYCSYCKSLCSMPRNDVNENPASSESQLQVGSTFNGVVHYNCPKCYNNKQGSTDLASPPHLQFIYMMRFILEDDTGLLTANLWQSEAEVFFQNTAAEKLVQDASFLTHVTDMLNLICPDDVSMETKPLIECCVKSYSKASGTEYQIFDTTIA